MAREQVAGAIILDRLRERITSGLYLGHWKPGDRLPSIREIADAEKVDRKTAAAAYRRLQEEGLVRVQARSGVYLKPPAGPASAGPLQRLHRQWLEHTFDGARALGLDTAAILHLIGEVAEVERLRLPVVDSDWSLAEAFAAELRDRLHVRATPYVLEELRPGDPVLAEAPLLVTTPLHGAELALLAPGQLVVEAILPPEFLGELRSRHATGSLLVLCGGPAAAREIRQALHHCGLPVASGRVHVSAAADRGEVAERIRAADHVFLWPGTPAWVDEVAPARDRVHRPARAIAPGALARIQAALLDAALRRVRGSRPESVRAM